MQRRNLIAVFTVAALSFTTPLLPDSLPCEAALFVEEFEKVSKEDTGLGVWERVVYSVVEAKSRSRNLRAPETKPTTACALRRVA